MDSFGDSNSKSIIPLISHQSLNIAFLWVQITSVGGKPPCSIHCIRRLTLVLKAHFSVWYFPKERKKDIIFWIKNGLLTLRHCANGNRESWREIPHFECWASASATLFRFAWKNNHFMGSLKGNITFLLSTSNFAMASHSSLRLLACWKNLL